LSLAVVFFLPVALDSFFTLPDFLVAGVGEILFFSGAYTSFTSTSIY